MVCDLFRILLLLLLLGDLDLDNWTICFWMEFHRMRPIGEPPSPRAAHAAAVVGTMVVFQVKLQRKPSSYNNC